MKTSNCPENKKTYQVLYYPQLNTTYCKVIFLCAILFMQIMQTKYQLQLQLNLYWIMHYLCLAYLQAPGVPYMETNYFYVHSTLYIYTIVQHHVMIICT